MSNIVGTTPVSQSSLSSESNLASGSSLLHSTEVGNDRSVDALISDGAQEARLKMLAELEKLQNTGEGSINNIQTEEQIPSSQRAKRAILRSLPSSQKKRRIKRKGNEHD